MALEYHSRLIQLPDELQIQILGDLPVQDLLKVTVICRKWNRLVYDGSLWTTINVAPFYKSLPLEVIIKLIKSASRFLKTANFRGCIQLKGQGLRTLAAECPNLQVLIIKDCRGLSTASISYFLQHAKQLRVLDVSGLDTVKSSTLLTTNLDKLEKLNMSWCRNITGPGILAVVQSSSVTLSYLKLNGCSQLDDSIMNKLGLYLPHITHFSLAACTSLTDTGLLAFLQSHALTASQSRLTHLNLSSCARLSDSSLRHLAQYTKQLTHLELAGCVLMTDQGFTYLAPRLQNLVHLDLEDLQHITGTTIQSIANHQPRLRRLCLSNCTQIAAEAIEHLVLQGSCNQLHHLELDNCTITDQVLDTIANYLQQQRLKSQQLKRAPVASTTMSSVDSSISFFSSQMAPSLLNDPLSSCEDRNIRIEVLDCANITESGVREALIKGSPMLTIKSFYSFQEEDDNEVTSDEQAVDNIHRYHRGRTNGSVRYSTLSSNTRRRVSHGAAGQHHPTGSCIIL